MYEKDLKFGQLYCSKTSIILRFDSSILGFAIYSIGLNHQVGVDNLFRLLLQYSELSLASTSHLSPTQLYDSGVNLYDLTFIKDTRGL